MKARLISSVVTVLAVVATAACGSTASTSTSGSPGASKTLTYWASNQGTSLENDKAVLDPELAKFEKQTGVKVNLSVIGWPDLLNKILAATTSGQGPDVLVPPPPQAAVAATARTVTMVLIRRAFISELPGSWMVGDGASPERGLHSTTYTVQLSVGRYLTET